MKAKYNLIAVLTLAIFLAVGATGTALAAKTIKLHHLNKDDPFDNPTGAMATVFKSLVEAGTIPGDFYARLVRIDGRRRER